MKIKIIFAALALSLAATTADAQSLKNIASSLINKSTGNSNASNAISSIVDLIAGSKKATVANLTGTWVYNQPAIAFESDNALNQAAAKIGAQTVQNKLGTAITKYGIKPGSATLTFKSDSTYTSVINGKTLQGTYKINDNTLTLYKGGIQTFKATVTIKATSMQLTFKADKLLSVVKGLGALNTGSSTLTTISQLANGYKGMQLGLQFNKQ